MIKLTILFRTAFIEVASAGGWKTLQRWELKRGEAFLVGGIFSVPYADVDRLCGELDEMAQL